MRDHDIMCACPISTSGIFSAFVCMCIRLRWCINNMYMMITIIIARFFVSTPLESQLPLHKSLSHHYKYKRQTTYVYSRCIITCQPMSILNDIFRQFLGDTITLFHQPELPYINLLNCSKGGLRCPLMKPKNFLWERIPQEPPRNGPPHIIKHHFMYYSINLR